MKDLTRGSSELEFASGFIPRSKEVYCSHVDILQRECAGGKIGTSVPNTYLPEMGAVMYIAFISLDL